MHLKTAYSIQSAALNHGQLPSLTTRITGELTFLLRLMAERLPVAVCMHLGTTPKVFGMVHKCLHTAPGKSCAIKKLALSADM